MVEYDEHFFTIAGGYYEKHLASTEVFDHTNGSDWSEVAALPTPSRGKQVFSFKVMQRRAIFNVQSNSGKKSVTAKRLATSVWSRFPGYRGATLSNTFHVAGGTNTSTNFDSILS